MKKILKIVVILFILSGLSILFFPRTRSRLTDFLSKSTRVNAKMLVVEGWLPDYALQKVVEEIQNTSYDLIVTTGIKSSELDYCLIGMDGYLIFYPGIHSDLKNGNDYHTLEVVAKSEMGDIYSCHINLLVNDLKVADLNIDNKSSSYKVSWYGNINNIDSIIVNFDNDMVDENGDRNLYVKEIIIDKNLKIPYQFNSVYDIGSIDNKERIVNDYESIAEFARIRLTVAGIDSSKIIPIPSKRIRFNRTLSSVLAFRDWLYLSKPKTTKINIMTLGIHSRRTWITYKSVLKKSDTVGIIAIPNSEIPDSEKPSPKMIYLETIQLIYYWIILFPFNFT